MGTIRPQILFAVLFVASRFVLPQVTAAGELRVSPAKIVVDRAEMSQQVLVTEVEGAARRDMTRRVHLAIVDPAVATVDADGLVQPRDDGSTELVIRDGTREQRVPVIVSGVRSPAPVSFAHDVIPLLTKARCNSGGCHGKAEGQNGFKLSLFGFDAKSDYQAIVQAGRGRRVQLASPDQSMLLRKATAETPHGGGRKIEPASPGYRRLHRWLASGAPFAIAEERPVVAIEVEPAEIVMSFRDTQQLRVTSIDSDGIRRCVTVEAEYLSNAQHIAVADTRGLLRATDVPGEAAILVRYQGHVAVSRVVLPRNGIRWDPPAEANFIDRLVWSKLTQLGIPPSPSASDSTYLRRVYFDTIGTMPTAEEARQFLNDPAPDKRARLVNALLERPEYADYWAMKWANLLRADKIKVTPQATVGMTRWLRTQFARNRPYDEMVREIMTIQGPIQAESPAAFFRAVDQPEMASRSVSQLFLGVRIECAQCHHHPSERWGQDDYAGLAGFFTGVAIKKLPDGTDALVARQGTDVKHPRTGEVVAARALAQPPANFAGVRDRRQEFAKWLTAPDNPYFARALVNRLWAHYFGRGLVEPIDDLRATNPATNEPLMSALEAHLREVRYDLRAFTRTLLASQAYQRDSSISDDNRDDQQHFSHAQPKAIPAEVLLDAICEATGVPEKFNGWPEGIRAIQVWDNRMPSYFFRIFGRPVRATVCECERSNEPSISQALHLINSPEINAKISHRHGIARKLAESSFTPDQLTDELYLGVLSRYPTADERQVMRIAFEDSAAGSEPTTLLSARQGAIEDILWTLLNSKEFLYVH